MHISRYTYVINKTNETGGSFALCIIRNEFITSYDVMCVLLISVLIPDEQHEQHCNLRNTDLSR
jgi:hypothetical protein